MARVQRKNQSTRRREFKVNNKERVNRLYKQIIQRSDIPKRLKRETFESYDTSVKEGFDKKLRLIKNFTEAYPNLEDSLIYLAGNVGNGKSHLAVAAAKVIAYKQAKEINEGISEFMPAELPSGEIFLFYVNWRSELKKIRSSYRNNNTKFSAIESIQKMQRAKVLIIDDLFARTKISSSDLDDIFEIIDYRYQRDKITIITSNKFPAEYLTSLEPSDLKDYRYNPMTKEDLDLATDRIASRILHGCGERGVIEFDGPNYRITKE